MFADRIAIFLLGFFGAKAFRGGQVWGVLTKSGEILREGLLLSEKPLIHRLFFEFFFKLPDLISDFDWRFQSFPLG